MLSNRFHFKHLAQRRSVCEDHRIDFHLVQDLQYAYPGTITRTTPGHRSPSQAFAASLGWLFGVPSR